MRTLAFLCASCGACVCACAWKCVCECVRQVRVSEGRFGWVSAPSAPAGLAFAVNGVGGETVTVTLLVPSALGQPALNGYVKRLEVTLPPAKGTELTSVTVSCSGSGLSAVCQVA